MVSTTIGFIGGGQMARALASGFVRDGLVQAKNIRVADVVAAANAAFVEQVPGATVCEYNADVAKAADVVFLAVKPQNIQQVAPGVCEILDANKLLVSICAGVTMKSLESAFHTTRIVRVMPNTPCLVGVGASAFCCASGATDGDAALVRQLLAAVGEEVVQLDEKHMDAVTGLSGSGPAFVYQVIEALADGGVSMGLTRDVAQRLATQTVLGAATMVRDTGEHPAVLKDRVASPGGTTIAGLKALETAGLRAALMEAVAAATRRSEELGQSK
jgi:pyrroline-5-carboxylate reductase